MKADCVKIQNLLEGAKSYIVPLFQRIYSWDKKMWEVLWNDIIGLNDMETPRPHFLGSVVNIPATSNPGGVQTYLLIDGQQRLTTVFILLSALRDIARGKDDISLADEIHSRFIINSFATNENDIYKLLPTKFDIDTFKSIINQEVEVKDRFNNKILEGYTFFEQKLQAKDFEIDYRKVLSYITEYLNVVSLVLDPDENPYAVFESLNAKGRALTQADLIKNFLFMKIEETKQDKAYGDYWMPMEKNLGDSLSEFIRHYLVSKIGTVKEPEVYSMFRHRVIVDNIDALEELKNLHRYAEFYFYIKHPQNESNNDLRRFFIRLNRFKATVTYPLLLSLYENYKIECLSQKNFLRILHLLESYLIRGYVCDDKTNRLERIFSSIRLSFSDNIEQEFKNSLKDYRKDSEFKERFIGFKFYGNGNKKERLKLILETLESNFGHKEKVSIDSDISIEHIMPQTLSDNWMQEIGANFSEIHDKYIHNIGNLTLTGYNSKLSNSSFLVKKDELKSSNFELNKYIVGIHKWNEEEILKRAEILADIAVKIWS